MTRLNRCSWIAAAMFVPFAAETAQPASAPAVRSAQASTIQELMDTRIDPSADVLWDSVAFIASATGEEDRRPRTPAQWDAVHQSALALIDAVDSLSVQGRRVGSLEKEPGPGELDVSEIQRRIDANPASFVRHARALRAAAQKALAAIEARDADGLLNAGGLIDEACESCHMVYWYPQQTRSR